MGKGIDAMLGEEEEERKDKGRGCVRGALREGRTVGGLGLIGRPWLVVVMWAMDLEAKISVKVTGVYVWPGSDPDAGASLDLVCWK
jgi:hypothetical protein